MNFGQIALPRVNERERFYTQFWFSLQAKEKKNHGCLRFHCNKVQCCYREDHWKKEISNLQLLDFLQRLWKFLEISGFNKYFLSNLILPVFMVFSRMEGHIGTLECSKFGPEATVTLVPIWKWGIPNRNNGYNCLCALRYISVLVQFNNVRPT